jgi:hypothetical protein
MVGGKRTEARGTRSPGAKVKQRPKKLWGALLRCAETHGKANETKIVGEVIERCRELYCSFHMDPSRKTLEGW